MCAFVKPPGVSDRIGFHLSSGFFPFNDFIEIYLVENDDIIMYRLSSPEHLRAAQQVCILNDLINCWTVVWLLVDLRPSLIAFSRAVLLNSFAFYLARVFGFFSECSWSLYFPNWFYYYDYYVAVDISCGWMNITLVAFHVPVREPDVRMVVPLLCLRLLLVADIEIHQIDGCFVRTSFIFLFRAKPFNNC